ncbi:glycosyltransferase [Chromobacterium sp. IIBBL 290-4]|uniref:glycosyltransferase n=1 Tax=Chromobacterium sp. IIBBL 290-4 TaxID=2953890 RepID=UPI0020B70E00|nr:glycosyltransferase [Chromobacterium sp. IIBBL 290-4]UTH75284.1 glycosyltransferase [Chromobacterium sp. IIBBL 290-4]
MDSLPKISMLLITYNQQRYALDALKGALSQDYGNLEIIVSDDCSSDETFHILSDFSAEYQGPHKLVLHRNERNVGIGENLNTAVSLSSGELLVVTAGDDISLPHRVSVLAKNWLEHGKRPDLLASYLQDLDQSGATHDVIPVTDLSRYQGVDAWLQGHPTLIGAAQAWTRRLYDEFRGIPSGVVAEDMLMAFRAFSAGGALTIPEPLVLYRRGGTTGKRRHLSLDEVKAAFIKKIDNTKIELLHMIEVAARKRASPALLRYFMNLYQKECLIEIMLRSPISAKDKLWYWWKAVDLDWGFKIRILSYGMFPFLFGPFFALKRLVRGAR